MSAVSPKEIGSPNAPGRALIPFVPPPAVRGWALWQTALVAVGFGLAVGAGGGAAYGLRHVLHWPGAQPAPVAQQTLHRLEDQVGRLQQSLEALRTASDTSRSEDQLRGLKRSVENLKQEMEQARASSATNVAQLAAKIDKVDHDPTPKLADIATRLERIEKQNASPVTTGSIPATPPAPPAATPRAAAAPPVPPAKPAQAAAQPKPETTQVAASAAQPPAERPVMVAGWVLRDVYDGMALVEGRGGDLREVEPGQYLPGAGQVRSIERRGRSWVVLTSHGVIGNTTF